MRLWIFAFAMFWPLAAMAEGTEVTLGGLKADPTAAVEVTSDRLSVSQGEGRAVFEGQVVVIQGTMRLEAARVEVSYGPDGQGIEEMTASGDVRLKAGTDAASGQEAVYRPDQSSLVMTGDVVLTQGAATMAGQKLDLDLATGLGQMEGRVTTTFPSKAKGG